MVNVLWAMSLAYVWAFRLERADASAANLASISSAADLASEAEARALIEATWVCLASLSKGVGPFGRAAEATTAKPSKQTNFIGNRTGTTNKHVWTRVKRGARGGGR